VSISTALLVLALLPLVAGRDAFLNRFVADYNRTRLTCLGYLAPLEALANLPGPNTNAGTAAL